MRIIVMTTTEQNLSNGAAAADASFADLGLSDTVLAAVEDMGYEAPTPVQALAIPEALAGRDVLAAAQTGTGKTAAFLLPTMDRLPRVKRTRARGRVAAQGPLMLVVTPTRELAQQIEKVCRAISKRTGHRSVTVVGGVGYNPQKDALKCGCDILIATPGRLQDLIDQEACSLDQVQVLVLDEADRMLDMGFLPAVRKIVSYTRDDRQTLLFSATLDEGQVGSITDLVHEPARVEIAPVTSTADTVEQYVLPVSLEAKNNLLTEVLKREGAKRVIVFTRTKHRADSCARRLARAGFTTAAIHGDRSQNQRERALRAFRAGECDLLVATDVLARGIDISDVSYVINFDVPEEPVDYIHRIGRTGRAGEQGWSLTFVTEDDVAEFYDIEALMGKTVELFDSTGLDLGAHPPVVDPERVPAKAPAGKKEKKRRRAKLEKARAARGDRRRSGGSDAPAGQSRRSQGDAGRSSDAGRVAQGNAVSVRAEEEPAASKPSSRKRSGRVRVRANEGSDVDVELLTEREVTASRSRSGRNGRGGTRGAGAMREGASGRGSRSGARSDAGRGAAGGSGANGGNRSGNRSGNRGGSGRMRADELEYRPSRKARDDWRNYDELGDRRSRGTRGGRAGGRDNRGSYGSRGANGNGGKRSTRRPGDRGGR